MHARTSNGERVQVIERTRTYIGELHNGGEAAAAVAAAAALSNVAMSSHSTAPRSRRRAECKARAPCRSLKDIVSVVKCIVHVFGLFRRRRRPCYNVLSHTRARSQPLYYPKTVVCYICVVRVVRNTLFLSMTRTQQCNLTSHLSDTRERESER